MKTFELALAPGAVAGVLTIFSSWLWMGVIFHRFQKLTPGTWRPENNLSYALSAGIHFFACLFLAFLFLLVARVPGSVFASGLSGAFRFAALSWIALAAPFAIEAAVFIRLHPWVVVGQVLDWLTTALLTCGVTAWWVRT